MNAWLLAAFSFVIVVSVAMRFMFGGEPSTWTPRQRMLAWLFFGVPFIAALFGRKLTKREIIGWAIFFAILAAGVAFQHITCLGLGRGEVCR